MRPKIAGPFLLVLCVACDEGNRAPDPGPATPAPPVAAAPDPADARASIVFLGTSLTAGLGVAPDEAYPARVQDTLDALDLPFRVINAGVSGQTSAGGVRRFEQLVEHPMAVLVIELGANDGLRGLDVDAMRENLQTIIDRARAAHSSVRIVIAGMQAPPNLGEGYATAFRDTFSALARDNDTALIPFLLDSVGGIPELNQADGIHPTPEGHRVMARTVWRVLEEVVGGRR